MNHLPTREWLLANQQALVAHLAAIRIALARHASDVPAAAAFLTDDPPALPLMPDTAPAALDTLSALFGLSPFERAIIVLCAGIELDAAFAPLCAAAQGDPQRTYPTFSLALAALPSPVWSALLPTGPLRHWQLIHVEPGRTLIYSPLRLDERILHYLTGLDYLDTRLTSLVQRVPVPRDLAPSQVALAQELAATWAQVTAAGTLAENDTPHWPVLQLIGPVASDKRAVAAQTCAQLGLRLYAMPAAGLPAAPGELELLLRLWQREALLSGAALFLDSDELTRGEPGRETALARAVETGPARLILSTRERQGPWVRPVLTFEVRRPAAAERRQLWESVLGEQAGALNGQLDRLVAQFDLDRATMASAWTGARGHLAAMGQPATTDAAAVALWDTCRIQARPQLDDLAQRIDPVATWDDLVLPAAPREVLREMAMHVRQRTLVYDTWGFAGKGPRGLGISALFAGLSGTGKTMAAEVLANELRLDLYRIDLSAVVSKYIGETEKNLRRVFDAADTGGAILLFDEADALFGKRSEVKDSHDRYANIEVGYLLQRMESYRGLAILTTNLKESLDDAFLRRIRFIVHFPFPDAAQRAEIWRRVWPAATPRDGLDAARLASLNVAGGNIRNIALHAAFLAAGRSARLGMSTHEIELTIERIVLHDLPAVARHRLMSAIEDALLRLLATHELPPELAAEPLNLPAATIEVMPGTSVDAMAGQIAQSIVTSLKTGSAAAPSSSAPPGSRSPTGQPLPRPAGASRG